MVTYISPSTKTVGFWSAVLATVFSITYIVGQLAEELKIVVVSFQKRSQLSIIVYFKRLAIIGDR